MIEYKGYQIKASPLAPRSYIIVTGGRGGKIPDVMTGMFTTSGIAKNIIDTYVENKGQDDGKKSSDSKNISKSGV